MSSYNQYLFNSQPPLNTNIVGPLRQQVHLQEPDDWNPRIYWERVQATFTHHNQPFVLLICSNFLRQRSCNGHTPAMYV